MSRAALRRADVRRTVAGRTGARRASLLAALGALATVAGMVDPDAAGAQVLQFQGGGSSLYQGYGGTLNIWGPTYEGQVGLGWLDGLRVSLFAKRVMGNGDTLRLGDDVIPVRLASDLFASTNGLIVQGAGVRRVRGRTSLLGFAGASATAVPAPFFAASRSERALGVLQVEHELTPRLTLSSHALFTGQQTVLQGAHWNSEDGRLTAGATAGVGSNDPYAAASVSATSAMVDLKASFVEMGEHFRRAAVPMPMQTEVFRENVLVTLRPRDGFVLSAGRQNFRQDSVLPGTDGEATLNQIFGSARVKGATLAAGLFDSRSGGVHNVSSYVSATRPITSWLQTDLFVLSTYAPSEARTTTPVLFLREQVTPRLNLLQVITRSGDRTSVSFGGGWTSGLASVGVDYQIVHTPFRSGTTPFVQTLALNVRLNIGGYQLTGNSFVSADGKVNYMATGSTYLYMGASAPGAAQPIELKFERYLLQGRVVDEAGAPVEGAAIEVDGELVFTDSQGRFFVRRTDAREVPLRVVVDEFILPGVYEVVRAPERAAAVREDRAPVLEIVVRRLMRGGGAARLASIGSVP